LQQRECYTDNNKIPNVGRLALKPPLYIHRSLDGGLRASRPTQVHTKYFILFATNGKF